MKILFGYDEDHYVDITAAAEKKISIENDKKYLIISNDDHKRVELAGYDPYHGILKHICILDDNNKMIKIPPNKEIKCQIPIVEEQILSQIDLKKWYDTIGKFITDPSKKLTELHKKIDLDFGLINDEYVEQSMVAKYLNENSKVLELGSNIGRNTMIISILLSNSKNLVTLESDPEIGSKLIHNLKKNNIDTNVEISALSKRRLIQNGWDTIPLDNINKIPDGWKEVKTISFDEIQKKYNIIFDTLVADCEGALYYILKDDENMLNNIKMVIIENDFKDFERKMFVNSLFEKNGLKRIFYQSGGWGPCYDFFWEVWKKD